MGIFLFIFVKHRFNKKWKDGTFKIKRGENYFLRKILR